MDKFNNSIETVIDQVSSEKKLCYLLGDYNINLLKYEEHQPTTEFLDMMLSSSFVPTINRPTRVTENTATLIDNTFTNVYGNDLEFKNGILYSDISHHFPIFHLYKIEQPDRSKVQLTKRLINQNSKDQLKQFISEIDWGEVYEQDDPQNAFTCFHSILSNAYNTCMPKITYNLSTTRNKPWITDALRTSIKRKNKIYKIRNKKNCNNRNVQFL